jgi:signal transduction histidine kinase
VTIAERLALLASKFQAAAKDLTQVPQSDLEGAVEAVESFADDASEELRAILRELR